MNRGLLAKALRESWPTTLGFSLLLAVVELGIAFVVPVLQKGLYGMVLQMGFARTMLTALLGTPVTEAMGTQILQAIPWVHPLVLLIVFAHLTVATTRLPAGEIDRGTIDLLLGLPVSRGQLWRAHTLVWALSGALLLVVGWVGQWAGTMLGHGHSPPLERLGIVLVNAYALYLATGGFALLVSAFSDRRSRAFGVVIAVIVASFLLTFLAEFWSPAHRVRFLSVLNYYRPFFVLQDGHWPRRDLAMLLGAALTCWAAGGLVWRRRDVHTL